MVMPGPWEMVIILLIAMVVFGAKRLPEIGKGLGKGIREFKKSLREISEDEKDDNSQIEEPK
ncbi:MAG TPA: twin-arginine translocase TatA/TatE family subunit [bacterium]|nr:twin-arginine translocase TatA/TatE family subunit [bacterium]HQO36439.1 twin-arginine translocase TatA/TatE family subunit [bacterium]HQP99811.1 twin-arginine translocase TatA/TatE family subunit [bacterium]